jgi:hypothetical protein
LDNLSKLKQGRIWRRNWRSCDVNTLAVKLVNVDWSSEPSKVQDYWNEFENKLIKVVDELVPLKMESENCAKEGASYQRMNNSTQF